ncbi:pyruvate, phosphate dikinase, partial [Patescibacteria group bacterium]|nr:pyruvate, phosphate dikinase [Patescibacteria group bacterium]
MGKKASRRRNRQVVCGFESSAHLSAAKRGGKGFSLAELVHLGVPMPPGFTVTTSVGRSSLQHGHLPRRLFGQIVREMEGLEQSTGRGFGHLVKPLLVSVRSGAEHSMPGMMDTILNLGLNPDTVLALARETGDERFAWDCYRRFLVSYGTVVHGIAASEFDKLWQKNGCDHDRESFHVRALKKFCRNCRQLIQRRAGSMEDDVWTQLTMASRAVFRSWESERARAYRRANNIPSRLGTAANIQAM